MASTRGRHGVERYADEHYRALGRSGRILQHDLTASDGSKHIGILNVIRAAGSIVESAADTRKLRTRGARKGIDIARGAIRNVAGLQVVRQKRGIVDRTVCRNE